MYINWWCTWEWCTVTLNVSVRNSCPEPPNSSCLLLIKVNLSPPEGTFFFFCSTYEITPRMRTWRQTLERCHSAAQVALCINQLECSIAWEKSVVRAVSREDLGYKEWGGREKSCFRVRSLSEKWKANLVNLWSCWHREDFWLFLWAFYCGRNQLAPGKEAIKLDLWKDLAIPGESVKA